MTYNKEWIRQYINNKYKTDENFRMRMRLTGILKGILRTGGYSRVFMSYGVNTLNICSKLGKRPSPNHELDHIIPCAAFDLSKPNQIKRCFSPNNLRWITKEENRLKHMCWEKDGVKYNGKYPIVPIYRKGKYTSIPFKVTIRKLKGEYVFTVPKFLVDFFPIGKNVEVEMCALDDMDEFYEGQVIEAGIKTAE